MFSFHLAANITFGYVFGDVSLHIIPPESLLHIHIHLGITGMNGIRGLVGFLEN
jgi:hypothetical protein